MLLVLALTVFEKSAFSLQRPNTVKSLVDVILLFRHNRTYFCLLMFNVPRIMKTNYYNPDED